MNFEFIDALFFTPGWILIIMNLLFVLKDKEEKLNVFVRMTPEVLRTSEAH